jgi:hypothetical protein
MSGEDIAARNRANAQKSTGPRTVEGKAIVAGNALRHGATGRPDRESVARWLAVILDRPEIGLADLMPEDEVGYRARALAEAEVRLISAERALREFEAGTAKPSKAQGRSELTPEDILDMLDRNDVTKSEIEAGLSLLKQIGQEKVREARDREDQHSLLDRYFREARAQRRRAFEAWAAMQVTGARASLSAKSPDSQNKARFLV